MRSMKVLTLALIVGLFFSLVPTLVASAIPTAVIGRDTMPKMNCPAYGNKLKEEVKNGN